MIENSHPLDFIIFGVPRSGTKALVNAFNLHPQVYCGMERFHFRTDHSRLTFPELFLDASTIRDRRDLIKLERLRRDLAKNRDIRYVGNKLPRYYFALDRINQEVPQLKNIWIYRSPYGFIPSWNRREQQSFKGQWPAGQIGLFGLLELFVCIENCLRLPKDVFVFPYAAGLGCSPAITLQALEFLGADPSSYDCESFERRQNRKTAGLSSRRENGMSGSALQEHEEELLAALTVNELDAIFEQERGLKLSEAAAPLRDYLFKIVSVLPSAMDRAFQACINSEIRSFGRQYFRRNRAELTGLLARMQGSTTIADFQSFGSFDRLKALYFQRSAIKRRLAAIRFYNA